jgi:hypothetical protein
MQELSLPAWVRHDTGMRRAIGHRRVHPHGVLEATETRQRARRRSPEWQQWLEKRQTLAERIQARASRAEGPRVLVTRQRR